MPWTADRFPPAMAGLEPDVRAKAIEIANALLESGHDEGQAIRIGIASARRWAARRGEFDPVEPFVASGLRALPHWVGRDRGWET